MGLRLNRRALAPFREFIEKVQQSVRGIKLAGLRRHRFDGEVRQVEGNWKQHAWNYMDNYHIRFVHKGPGGLADAIELETYTTQLYEYSALQWAYARRPEDGFAPQQVAAQFKDTNNADTRVFVLWAFTFP